MSPLKGKSRSVRLGLITAPLLLTLTGCSQVSGLGFPEGVSSVNDISLSLWQFFTAHTHQKVSFQSRLNTTFQLKLFTPLSLSSSLQFSSTSPL
jgi:hypothetical protein